MTSCISGLIAILVRINVEECAPLVSAAVSTFWDAVVVNDVSLSRCAALLAMTDGVPRLAILVHEPYEAVADHPFRYTVIAASSGVMSACAARW